MEWNAIETTAILTPTMQGVEGIDDWGDRHAGRDYAAIDHPRERPAGRTESDNAGAALGCRFRTERALRLVIA
jgi:hypothetical protein